MFTADSIALPAHDRLLAHAREVGWRVGWTCKRGEGRFQVTCWVLTDVIDRPYRFRSDMDDRRTIEQAVELTAGAVWTALGPGPPTTYR